MPFITQGKTNWKFLLIVVVLAVIVGGGAIWLIKKQEVQFTKLPEIKIPEKSAMEQKVSVITDKTKYKRNDIIKYTIINNSSSVIFPIISEGRRLIELQEYNYDNKAWEPPKDNKLIKELLQGYNGYYPVFLIFNENPISPINILGKEENNFPLDKILNQFNDKLETYRLVFLYYESNTCYENSFWGNPECGKASASSWLNDNWEVIRIAISNEFKVEGTTLIEADIARSFCLERYKENDLSSKGYLSEPYLESVFFLDFDNDEDKEIISLCWDRPDAAPSEGLLFVLDKQNGEYQSVLEKEVGQGQRHTLGSLRINDIDKDGIDEIMYEENAWYMAGGDSYLYLYSPKYKEWFYRDNWWDETTGTKKEGVKISPNLDLEMYKVFKDFISIN